MNTKVKATAVTAAFFLSIITVIISCIIWPVVLQIITWTIIGIAILFPAGSLAFCT